VLFFVAVGTLIDPRAIPASLPWIGLVIALVVLVKGGSIFAAVRRAGTKGVVPWQVGGGLAQVGEFTFVLAAAGAAKGWISPHVYTALLTAVVASIAIVTIVVRQHPWRRSVAASG
jgi:CPA2 family monovalent cation:H+ antiporter-2